MSGCLVLNTSYEPLTPLSVKRAIRLVLQGKAEVLEASDELYHWEKGSMPRPEVIRLKKFVRIPSKFRRKVTNTFLFARDNYTCQYCGKHEKNLKPHKGHSNRLTRDHITPQSKGGGNSWTNCVTSCSPCNARKDNKTPAEAGMKLLSTPVEPHLVHLVWAVRKLTPTQRKYITIFYGRDVTQALEK